MLENLMANTPVMYYRGNNTCEILQWKTGDSGSPFSQELLNRLPEIFLWLLQPLKSKRVGQLFFHAQKFCLLFFKYIIKKYIYQITQRNLLHMLANRASFHPKTIFCSLQVIFFPALLFLEILFGLLLYHKNVKIFTIIVIFYC